MFGKTDLKMLFKRLFQAAAAMASLASATPVQRSHSNVARQEGANNLVFCHFMVC